MRKKGFTLIELLVVIAIIAMLLAIILPSLKKAKQMAKDVICKSNLKQWGVVLRMYGEDSNGRVMSVRNTGASDSWMEAFRNYYDNPDLRLCPEASRLAREARGDSVLYDNTNSPFIAWRGSKNLAWSQRLRGDPDAVEDYGSYGINNWIYDHPDTTKKRYWRKLDDRYAQSVPIFFDCAWRGSAPDVVIDGVPPAVDDELIIVSWDAMRRVCMNRHYGHVNIMFMDGHAAPVRLKQLWDQKWNRLSDRGGYQGQWPEWMTRFHEQRN